MRTKSAFTSSTLVSAAAAIEQEGTIAEAAPLQGICHTDEYTRSGKDPEVSVHICYSNSRY